MQRILIFILSAFCCWTIIGCSGEKDIELTGDRAFEQKQFLVAAKLLQDEMQTDDAKTVNEKTLKVAQCYDYANKTKEAAEWYKKYYDITKEPAYFYHHINKLKATNDYAKCEEELKDFIKQHPTEKLKAAFEIQQCENAEEWLQTGSKMYVVKKIDSVNTFRNEYAPVGYEKNKLVFTSDRSAATGDDKYGWTGEKFTDLFVSELINGKFQRPRKFSQIINTPAHEGTCTFTKNFNAVIFTRCGSPYNTDDYCQLLISEKQADGEWTEGSKLLLFGTEDTLQNVGQPFLTEDGKSLYFSSDAAGGLGGKDLYVCTKTSNGWGKPRNLGGTVNSSGDDVFPYVRKDGTLFFSSNGHGGMGGLDVFYCNKNGTRYSQPFNLKSPINTGADDFGFSFVQYNEKGINDTLMGWGYLSSPRVGGRGGDDIYKFELKKEKVYTYWLSGVVNENKYEDPKDSKSKVVDTIPVAGAIVQLFEINKTTGMQHLLDADSTSSNGSYAFQIEKDKQYKVLISKKNYFNKSDAVSSKNISNPNDDAKIYVYKNLKLEPIIKNKMIEIPNIFYDLDKWNIRTDAAAVLDSLVVPLMEENPTLKFELGSHTDSRGNDEYNMTLSQKRADAVVEYLIQKGINAERLVAKGYGETQIINRCTNGVDCTEEEHQQNRRTTFRVLDEAKTEESNK